MTAGVVQTTGGLKVWANSNMCADVVAAFAPAIGGTVEASSCSTDPVTAGSLVRVKQYGYFRDYNVMTIDATPYAASDMGTRSADWLNQAFLLQAVLVVAAVFILFHGYRAGDKA